MTTHSSVMPRATSDVQQPTEQHTSAPERVSIEGYSRPEPAPVTVRSNFADYSSVPVSREGDAVEQDANQGADKDLHDYSLIPATHEVWVSGSSNLSMGENYNAPELPDLFSQAGRPLSRSESSYFGKRFGKRFQKVQIYDTPAASKVAKSLGASAFTVDEKIVLNSDKYRPETRSGRALMAHELEHTLQQTSGKATSSVQRQEADADHAARAVLSGKQPPSPVGAGARIAMAREDWLYGTPDVTSLGTSEILNDISAIREWIDGQTSSSEESVRMEEALATLQNELARRRRRHSNVEAPSRARNRRQRRRARQQTQAEEVLVEQPMPRILAEQASPEYVSREEATYEYDLIESWARRSDIDDDTRSILRGELQRLGSSVEQQLQTNSQARREIRLRRVLSPPGEGYQPLQQLVQNVENMSYNEEPGFAFIHYEGERYRLTAEQADGLRAQVLRELSRGRSRVSGSASSANNLYDIQTDVNDDYPVISAISGWLGDVDDPGMALRIRNSMVQRALEDFNAQMQAGNLEEAVRLLAIGELHQRHMTVAVNAWHSGLIEGAETAVRTLEITRDVSFAIAGAIGAIVAAPAVAAYGAGLGLSGAGLTLFTTTGTGVVVATGQGLTGGTAAAAGELYSGGSLEQAGDAFVAEGGRNAREGLLTGATGGLGLSLGTTLRVGQAGVNNPLLRRMAAEGTADLIGGTASEYFRPRREGEAEATFLSSLQVGAGNAAFGSLGPLAGSRLRNPLARGLTESGVSSLGAGTATYLQTGDLNAAILNGSIALGSSGAIQGVAGRRANVDATQNRQQRAHALGRQHRQQAQAGALALQLNLARPNSLGINSEVPAVIRPLNQGSHSNAEPPSPARQQLPVPANDNATPQQTRRVSPHRENAGAEYGVSDGNLLSPNFRRTGPHRPTSPEAQASARAVPEEVPLARTGTDDLPVSGTQRGSAAPRPQAVSNQSNVRASASGGSNASLTEPALTSARPVTTGSRGTIPPRSGGGGGRGGSGGGPRSGRRMGTVSAEGMGEDFVVTDSRGRVIHSGAPDSGTQTQSHPRSSRSPIRDDIADEIAISQEQPWRGHHTNDNGLPSRNTDIEGVPLEESSRISGGVDPDRRSASRLLADNMGFNGPNRPTGWQAHHIFPWQLREHPAVYHYELNVAGVSNPRAVDPRARWMNAGENGIALPASADTPGGQGLTIHRGSHRHYSEWVESRLDQLWGRYRHGEITDAQLRTQFESLVGEFENTLRSERFGRLQDGRVTVR